MAFPENLIQSKVDKKVKKVSRGDLRKHVKNVCMKKTHMGKGTVCNSTEGRKYNSKMIFWAASFNSASYIRAKRRCAGCRHAPMSIRQLTAKAPPKRDDLMVEVLSAHRQNGAGLLVWLLGMRCCRKCLWAKGGTFPGSAGKLRQSLSARWGFV